MIMKDSLISTYRTNASPSKIVWNAEHLCVNGPLQILVSNIPVYTAIRLLIHVTFHYVNFGIKVVTPELSKNHQLLLSFGQCDPFWSGPK